MMGVEGPVGANPPNGSEPPKGSEDGAAREERLLWLLPWPDAAAEEGANGSELSNPKIEPEAEEPCAALLGEELVAKGSLW